MSSTSASKNTGLDNVTNKLKDVAGNIKYKMSGLIDYAGLSDITILKDLARKDGITQFMIFLICLLLFVIFLWGFNKLYLDTLNCSNIAAVYKNPTLISSINVNNPMNDYLLRDFYIKTAYNCCASGRNKNDFVNLCALKNCIKQGARCLDFEIYSVGNKAVIAVSSVTSYNIKESYNTVPFKKAMEVVALYAFSGSNCPNPDDPLILNFRIKSDNKAIYDDMAKAIYNTLEERLLGKKYSYESYGYNLGSKSILELMKKVIIVVDKANPLFVDTLLNEYVNMASNTPFMRTLRFNDIKFTPDMDELVTFNKQNMTIALPEISPNIENYSSALVQTYGCQLIGMSFQNFDSNMEYYSLLFDQAGSAFILKPERLRYIVVTVPAAPLAEQNLSYGPRVVNAIASTGNPVANIYY
jgi:hypothetical protein